MIILTSFVLGYVIERAAIGLFRRLARRTHWEYDDAVVDAMHPALAVMFVHARQEFPDARAASQLFRGIDKLLPRIDLAPAVLERRAKQMEADLQASLKRSASQMKSMKMASEMMYR